MGDGGWGWVKGFSAKQKPASHLLVNVCECEVCVQ